MTEKNMNVCRLQSLWVFCTVISFGAAPPGSAFAGPPIKLHPSNPRYFEWRGKPTVLVTSGEHYGAVLNQEFDYVRYLDRLQADGLNLTRTFSGTYREIPASFGITDNPLAPKSGKYLCPWARSGQPGDFDGGNKFDVTRFDERYFRRLKDFLAQAQKRGIVVELVLFCPMYNEDLWRACPMNTANNINAIGNCPLKEAFTGQHQDLLEVQLAVTQKIVQELKEFDNLYYEVCNEPYFGGVTMDWQHRIIEAIVATERDFPVKHLISLNIANGRAKIENPHPAVSIFNFHYCVPPDVVALNGHIKAVIGENETGFRGKADVLYRTEGWDFLLAGGALYNNLDYSFTTTHPDGSFLDYKSPGGGSPELRRQLRVLKEFMESLDFLSMRPDHDVIRHVEPKLTASALVELGKTYAVYLHVPLPNKPKDLSEHLREAIEAKLTLNLPKGDYAIEWIDTKTGEVAKDEPLSHKGGPVVLGSPAFANDVALRVKAKDSKDKAMGHSFQFRHHFVDDNLPGDRWGQTALVDIDRDGDLDFITGQSGGEIRWYEFQKPEKWVSHLLGTESPSDVGGAALDVNRDGRIDFVTGGAWFEQPKDPKTERWRRHDFDPKLRAVHDIITADLDGDGRAEIITMSDKNDVRFYRIPHEDPTMTWPLQSIGPAVHAGLSAGDLDGDGDTDIVRSQVWFENLGKGNEWREHKFCDIPWADRKEQPFYYLASRSWVSDLNRDGRLDIILTENEIPGGRVAWFEAPKDPKQPSWTPHILPTSDDEARGPYHSLQLADFDRDGDLDIFAGEMEHLGKPPHRWFIWENVQGDGSQFAERVILDQGLGTHETQAGDVDGDGDIDLAGKLWRPVPGNGNKGRNHVDFLENLTISQKP